MKFSDIASAPTQGKVSSIQVQPAKHGALFAVGSWGTGNTSSINIRSIDTSSPQGGFDAYSTSNNMNSALSSAERISEKLASYSMKGDVTDISWCRGVLFSSSSLGSLHMLQMSQGMNKQQQSISLDQAHEFSNIHSGSITSVAVQESQGAVSVVTTGEDGKINFIDPYQKQIYMSKQTSSTSLYGACFASHNSNNLFTVGMGGRLQQWDVRQAASSSSNRPSNTYVDTNSRALLSLRPHPSRPHVIATGSVEGLLNIWDVRSNAVPTCSLQAHQSMLWDLLFLPTDPTKLLTCGEDGNLIVWDFNKNNANPTSIRFSSEQRDAIQPTKLYDNTLSLNTLAIDTESNTILCGADSQNILHLKHY